MTGDWEVSERWRVRSEARAAPSLLLAAKRTGVGAGVQGLSTVPAEALLGYVACFQTLTDILQLRGVVIDVRGRGQVLEELRGSLVPLLELGGQRLHHDGGDLPRNPCVPALGRCAAALG